MCHVDPSQCSINVWVTEVLVSRESPTAQTSVCETADTPCNQSDCPARFSAVLINQSVTNASDRLPGASDVPSTSAEQPKRTPHNGATCHPVIWLLMTRLQRCCASPLAIERRDVAMC